jgi:hypothetical protein
MRKIVVTICNDTGKTEFEFGRFEYGKQLDAQDQFFLTSSLEN